MKVNKDAFVRAINLAEEYTNTLHIKQYDDSHLIAKFKDGASVNFVKILIPFEGEFEQDLLFDIGSIKPVAKLIPKFAKNEDEITIKYGNGRVTFEVNKMAYSVAMLAEDHSNFFDRDITLEFPYEFTIDKPPFKSFVSEFKDKAIHFTFTYNNVLGLRILFENDVKTRQSYLQLTEDTDYDAFFTTHISSLNLWRAIKSIGDNKTITLKFAGDMYPMMFEDEFAQLVVAPVAVREDV